MLARLMQDATRYAFIHKNRTGRSIDVDVAKAAARVVGWALIWLGSVRRPWLRLGDWVAKRDYRT